MGEVVVQNAKARLMDRRVFLISTGALALAPPVRAQDAPRWSAPVLDLHWHMRKSPEANLAHMAGSGVTQANLLAGGNGQEMVSILQAQNPHRFPSWFASSDITKPEAESILTQAVKNGASGFGEIKFHVAADGPELQRMYALAGELDVPIMVHFQEVGHTPTEGTFASGWKRFAAMLKKYPRTKFIGHADAFWANISADYAEQEAYPTGAVVRGGVTDKLLGDYPNLFGDMSANSGNNALSRDAAFTKDFLHRHQGKLMFGSDCNCSDGRGTGTERAAPRMRGKCVARETLTVLANATTPPVFKKLVWDNAHTVLKIPV
jgi:predicted TIM-barrel fold metal-dependent hydrolase